MKNAWGKTRKQSEPYLSVSTPDGWTWKVLKAYKSRSAERKDPYARWFCAVSSPMTYNSADLGDVYIKDIPLDEGARAVLAERATQELVPSAGEGAVKAATLKPCGYLWWNRNTKSLEKCGAVACESVRGPHGNVPLCAQHLAFVKDARGEARAIAAGDCP